MGKPKYTLYQVVVIQPGGILRLPWLTEANSRHAYNAWRERLGEACTRVELHGRTADGTEALVEHCDLRSDLHAAVKKPVTEALPVQLMLAGTETV